MSEKTTIYCAFSGLGKTYFCQHNLGWIDLDEESWNSTETTFMLPVWIKNYLKYGYKVITGCGGQTLQALNKAGYDVTLILPENTKEAKEIILNRLATRGYDQEYAKRMTANYDVWYNYLINHKDSLASNIVFVPAGKYLSDVLK